MANLTGFENLIQKVEQNLKTAETNAQNLSRKFTKTSSQLKGSEKKKNALGIYVRKTELKIAALVAEQAKTKRILNGLYAELVSVVLKRKPRVENAVDASEEGGVLSPACRLQLRHCGAVAATCQRAVYMRYIDDCYRELTDKQAAQSEIKQTLYDVPLCIYSLNGKCENQKCPYNHLVAGNNKSESSVCANNFRRTEYGKFCRAQPKLDSRLVLSRTAMSKRALDVSARMSSTSKRYFEIDGHVANKPNTGYMKNWQQDFTSQFARYFEPILYNTGILAANFYDINSVIAEVGIRSQALLMRSIWNESMPAAGCPSPEAEPASLAAEMPELAGLQTSEAPSEYVGYLGRGAKATLLESCLLFVSKRIEESCCDCHLSGHEICVYKTDACETFLVNANIVLSHGRLTVLAGVDVDLWIFYISLIRRWSLVTDEIGLLDIIKITCDIYPHSKMCAIMLSDLFQNFHDRNWSQIVLKTFLKTNPLESTETLNGISFSVGQSILQLALLAQVDEIIRRNIPADIAAVVFMGLLDVTGESTTCDVPALWRSQFELLCILDEGPGAALLKNVICNRQSRLILWASYMSYVVSGQTNAQVMWSADGNWNFAHSLDWSKSVISMRSLLNGDNSFFAHIMTILRGALLDTGVLCQLDVSFDDVTSNQSDAFHFQFVRSFTESLQSGQAGADGNHECSSDLVKDIVWWHALLLLEASGSDISRLCAILLPVASKNCYGLFYSATLYPLLFPDFGCVFSLCTDDMAKLCGEQSPFEDKEKLLYMVKKQQQTNVSLIALRDYLDMKIGPAQFLLTMSGLISTGDSMAQLVQESFWEMELVFNNNSAHPLEIVACWLMIGMQEKYLSLSNFPRLQSSMSCYTFITAIDTSFMLKMVTGVVIIVLDNFQHEPGNLTDCFHYAVEVIKNNLSIRVTHSQTAGISLFSSAKFIELIDVICLMNVFVAYCESEGITMADCLLQCVGRKIPGSSFLFEHFINQIESLHRNNPTGSACEAFLCAVRSGRCSYARIIDLSCECSQEMYSHSDKLKVHCTIANFFEEKLVGERSRAGSEHITMHYYGLKWCGYSVLKNMDSLLLLRLGMSCFWAEKYLCVYAIQQELFKRSDFGAFDVACCVHLMTHTAFSVPSDFASANVACIYPIMEPEVNIFQTSEKRDRRLLTVIPKPLVAVNLINASTLPKKCSLDGLLNGAIPFALSLAQQLKELNLSACSLVVYPIHLLRLNNLVRLILSHNMLQNLPTDHFSNAYPGLIYLDLSFNKYTSLPSELSRLLNLQELYMNDNRIEYIPDRLLQMKSLRVFDLSNNLLKALPPGIIALRKQIQYLKLSGNPMIQSVAGRIKLPFPTILSSDTTSRVGLVKRNLDSNATPEFTKYHLQKKIRLKSQITEVGTDFDNAILIADKFDSSQQVASGELVDHDEIFQCETRVEPVLAIASTCSSSVKGAEDRSDADVSVQKVKQNLSEFTPFGAL